MSLSPLEDRSKKCQYEESYREEKARRGGGDSPDILVVSGKHALVFPQTQ